MTAQNHITARRVLVVSLVCAAPGLHGCQQLGIPKPSLNGVNIFNDDAVGQLLGASVNNSLGLDNNNRDRVLANLVEGLIGQALESYKQREFEDAERAKAQTQAKRVTAEADQEVLASAKESDSEVFVPYEKKTLEDGTVVVLYARADTDGNVQGDETYEVPEEEVRETIAKQRDTNQLTEVDGHRVLMLDLPPDMQAS